MSHCSSDARFLWSDGGSSVSSLHSHGGTGESVASIHTPRYIVSEPDDKDEDLSFMSK